MPNPVDDSFKIYLARLRDGHSESIDMELSVKALDLGELEGSWASPIQLKGKAYCVGSHLLLSLTIEAKAKLPCRVCDHLVPVEISIKDYPHTEVLADYPGGIFDGMSLVKELLFLELPTYVECGQGRCLQQEEISHLLKKEVQKHEKGYYPFKNLGE